MKRNICVLLWIMMMVTTGFAQETKVQPTWESLNERGYPQWFSDAKLGIFVHWGLYSVPAYASKEGYGEWFYRGLMMKDSGRLAAMSYYADTTKPVFEQYSELTKYWHAELWNPDEWAQLFKDAGAKYVLLVTKHHDGYCLWDSPQQPQWNSVVSGPHRNIVEDLTKAVRKSGLRMGFYYSLPEWSNPRHIWMEDPDNEISDYVDNYMIPQFKELVDRYKPDVIFSDGDWNNSAEQFRSQEIISWYYNTVGPDAIVNNRWGNGTKHGFLTPEYSAGIANTKIPWAECRGIGRSFGLNRNEDLSNYLTDDQLIQHFVELVAHGGGMTLNVGPNADGTIPFIQQERLLNLGKWLKINGNAIYGSKPYTIPCQRVESITTHSFSGPLQFDWVRNAPLKDMPVDNFDIDWSGTFKAPSEGVYRFKAVANDEMTVVGDGDTILYYNSAWAENTPWYEVHLAKDQNYQLDVSYHEKDLEATAALYVSVDGGEFQPVSTTWTSAMSWQTTTRCFTTKGNNLYIFEFEYPDPENPLVIYDMPILNRNAGMRLLGTFQGELKWKQDRKGRLTIDFSKVSASDLHNLAPVWVIEVGGFPTGE
ncbi:MAG: alpha-L-fucosidase [Bacteroidales bacterium]|nr:alpha-L-fucosidase [Bacteroidales bacterium]